MVKQDDFTVRKYYNLDVRTLNFGPISKMH
jgi:hypothetical protein